MLYEIAEGDTRRDLGYRYILLATRCSVFMKVQIIVQIGDLLRHLVHSICTVTSPVMVLGLWHIETNCVHYRSYLVAL
jgi:hypothetical protein